jgi:SMC interacting uncharacterized protein involved in chromosome segregation
MAGIRIEFGLDSETIRLLSEIFGQRLDRIDSALASLEEHMSKVDDKITAFVTSVNDSFTQLGTSLDNISADEANLAKQIADLQAQIANDPNSDLSPESQAKLDAVQTAAASMAVRTKTLADSVPDSVTPPGL